VCGTLQIKVNSERCMSSVQELNEDYIEFSLSTQTRRVSKLSGLSYYTLVQSLINIVLLSITCLRFVQYFPIVQCLL